MPEGGVMTPTCAFYHNKSVFHKLEEAGIQFQVLNVDEEKIKTENSTV